MPYIEDYPQIIQDLVVKEQIAQGNKPDKKLYLGLDKHVGNFTWDESIFGVEFWCNIASCNPTNISKINSILDKYNINYSKEIIYEIY